VITVRTWRESQIIMQAQIWKGEARCANHTLSLIYKAVTGAKQAYSGNQMVPMLPPRKENAYG
jgi:hypothetical protein